MTQKEFLRFLVDLSLGDPEIQEGKANEFSSIVSLLNYKSKNGGIIPPYDKKSGPAAKSAVFFSPGRRCPGDYSKEKAYEMINIIYETRDESARARAYEYLSRLAQGVAPLKTFKEPDNIIMGGNLAMLLLIFGLRNNDQLAIQLNEELKKNGCDALKGKHPYQTVHGWKKGKFGMRKEVCTALASILNRKNEIIPERSKKLFRRPMTADDFCNGKEQMRELLTPYAYDMAYSDSLDDGASAK